MFPISPNGHHAQNGQTSEGSFSAVKGSVHLDFVLLDETRRGKALRKTPAVSCHTVPPSSLPTTWAQPTIATPVVDLVTGGLRDDGGHVGPWAWKPSRKAKEIPVWIPVLCGYSALR